MGRPNNVYIESWFNTLKNNLLNEKNLKLGRFIEEMKIRNNLLVKAADCAPFLKNWKNKNKNLHTPVIRRVDEEDPYDISAEENWKKKDKQQRKPKYSGKTALRKFIRPRKIMDILIMFEYCKKIKELQYNIIVFKFEFNKLWPTFIYNFSYLTLFGKQYLATEIVYACISLLINGKNMVCLDQYQVDSIEGKKLNLNDKVFKICQDMDYIIIPICKNNHFTVAIINLIDGIIVTYNPLKSQNIDKISGNIGRIFATELMTLKNSKKKFQLKTNFDFPQQQDGYNCGPLIIYAVDMIINNTRINDVHDQNKSEDALQAYRKKLQHLLFDNSESVKEHCLLCFEISPNSTRCNICRRSVCDECRNEMLLEHNICKFCT